MKRLGSRFVGRSLVSVFAAVVVLAQPVTLSYPTFAAAAEASGISRIWAGVHWPVDNERGGEELGRRSARVFGGAPSNLCSTRRLRRRLYSRRYVRLFGFTTMKRRTTPPILKLLRGSQSTCPQGERAYGEALWSMRCPRERTS